MFAKSKMRLLAATAVLPVMFVAGCGSGSNSAVTPPSVNGPIGTLPTIPTPGPTSAPPNATNVSSQTAIGLTSNNTLVRFNTQSPANTTPITLTGLTGGATLLAIDFRVARPGDPGASAPFALARTGGNSYQLFRIDFAGNTATLRPASAVFNANLTSVGFDHDPRTDEFRVVSANGTNLRLGRTGTVNNVEFFGLVDTDGNATGTLAGVQVDPNITFAGGDFNQTATPRLVGTAITFGPAGQANTTFGIDAATNSLVIQGGQNGTAADPNFFTGASTGRVSTVGRLGLAVGDETVGFDIAQNGAAFATFVTGGVTRLTTVNLNTGQVAIVGNVGLAANERLVGFTILQ